MDLTTGNGRTGPARSWMGGIHIRSTSRSFVSSGTYIYEVHDEVSNQAGHVDERTTKKGPGGENEEGGLNSARVRVRKEAEKLSKDWTQKDASH